MLSVEELESQVRQLQGELDTAIEQRDKMAELGESYHLAIELHERLCHNNHTDGCSWHYQKDSDPKSWDLHPHKRYHKMAVNILHITDFDTAIRILNAIKG